MNIMNKLYKCALGLLTTLVLSCSCFSSAEICTPYFVGGSDTLRVPGNVTPLWSSNYENDIFCLNAITDGVEYSIDNITWNSLNKYSSICLDKENYGNLTIMYYKGDSATEGIHWVRYDGECYNSKLTSLQCQTEYNLIPISEVTANYCKLNFDLIDPAECPINEGTGAIVRSNLTINNTPYAQNQNINVFIPDFLAWNVAFNDFNTVIEVEGYNADEEYIENVINNEKLTPTNEDFEQMLTGFMTNYFPYLALALIFLYLARKIFKLFK